MLPSSALCPSWQLLPGCSHASNDPSRYKKQGGCQARNNRRYQGLAAHRPRRPRCPACGGCAALAAVCTAAAAAAAPLRHHLHLNLHACKLRSGWRQVQAWNVNEACVPECRCPLLAITRTLATEQHRQPKAGRSLQAISPFSQAPGTGLVSQYVPGSAGASAVGHNVPDGLLSDTSMSGSHVELLKSAAVEAGGNSTSWQLLGWPCLAATATPGSPQHSIPAPHLGTAAECRPGCGTLPAAPPAPASETQRSRVERCSVRHKAG